MIAWLQSVDASLFRQVNLSLANPIFDKLMPLASDPPGLGALLAVVFAIVFWKGNARARVCVSMLLLSLVVGDWLIASELKHAIARPRPFHTFADARVLVGKSDSFAMPSSHAMNWFGAAMVLCIYYRRSLFVMLPLAFLVAFSRVYNGVHYPSDVLAGAVLGAGCAAAMLTSLQTIWQIAGDRWFPIWRSRFPSLLNPEIHPAPLSKPNENATPSALDAHWFHLGIAFIVATLLIQTAYLASGKIELSEDEAYQWNWSKHPALSYYSKPPMIALAQFAGTHLWGDNQFGVRFFSPIIAAAIAFILFRFLSRELDAKTAFIFLIIVSVTPLMALGSILMTVDPLSVLFWTAAMIAGWRAVQPFATTRQWLWVGLWTGLGFLSKYTNLFQVVCWAVFFLLWPPARKHLRRPGPWLALLITAVCSLPVVIWNSQHHWITAGHVWSDGGLSQTWRHTFTLEFLLTEAGVLHPVFFIAAVWAAIAFWRRDRRDPLALFFFSMGAPLFLMYLAISLHSRVEANWIAPAVVPSFCLMALFWRNRWPSASAILKPLLAIAIGVGAFAVVLFHESNLTTKIIGRSLPPKFDPLRRVRGWKELARVVDEARQNVLTAGKPVFIICEHYGFTSEITFYLPEAKARAAADPLVFFYTTAFPVNQYYFWPGYEKRAGDNALFVREIDRPPLRPGWFSRWWHRDPDIYIHDTPQTKPLPVEVRRQFDSITDLGIKDIAIEGHGPMRRIQLFDCRNLHPFPPGGPHEQ
jgi:membrane-associated phospholipid phosphatase